MKILISTLILGQTNQKSIQHGVDTSNKNPRQTKFESFVYLALSCATSNKISV